VHGLRRGDETGQALVEFALVLPVLVLLMGVAFDGWNGMQLSIRLTSAARAGALTAASELTDPATYPSPQCDAANAVNAEEDTNIYQCTDANAPNYVNMTTQTDSILGSASIGVVTITISNAPVTLVPFVGTITVSAHAAARYS
jgi:Flp pilus assembly protein TadG